MGQALLLSAFTFFTVNQNCQPHAYLLFSEIFVQLCHFWHQAGHTEKAVAAFQAMIELNLFSPPNLEDSTSLSAQVRDM